MRSFALLASVAILCLVISPARSEDRVLMIGGGPTPQSSQLSIEQNMLFFKRMLGDIGRSDLVPHVLFASGRDAVPDVCQHIGPRLPSSLRLLSQILGSDRFVQLEFRPHDIGEVNGPADRGTILSTLAQQARELQPGDRLILYVSAHGGKGDPTSNGYISTWGGEELSVRDLGNALDQFDPEVRLLVVMVQCYSGAFANILFEGGNPDRPLAKHRRAGFFATVDSRPAAGCSADTKVDDYHEYSTSFLSALSRKDRLGKPVPSIDLNEDGQLSWAEAHACAVEQSPTIDICYRTSDRYLQAFSTLDSNKKELMSEQAPLEDLLRVADPVRRHNLEALVEQLDLPREATMAEAEKRAKRISFDRRKSKNARQKLEDEADRQAGHIEDSLLVRWPFLDSGFHPQTQTLLAEHPEQLARAIENHDSFADWKKARDRADEMIREDLVRERLWAKYQRILLVAKSIARAENLKRAGSADQKSRYEELLELENSSLMQPGTLALPRAN